MCWWAAVGPCAESSFGTERESSCVLAAALQQLAALFQVSQCYGLQTCSVTLCELAETLLGAGFGPSKEDSSGNCLRLISIIIISVVEGYKCTTALKKKKREKLL